MKMSLVDYFGGSVQCSGYIACHKHNLAPDEQRIPYARNTKGQSNEDGRYEALKVPRREVKLQERMDIGGDRDRKMRNGVRQIGAGRRQTE